MARPAKPVEVKLREGNPGRRPLPSPVAVIPGQLGAPAAPSGLSAPGKRFWRDTWSVGMAWLSPELDYAVAETAARTFDECAVYRKAVRQRPVVSEPLATPTGVIYGERLVANPAEGMLRRAERQLERWLVALAIPPTARARLGLVQVKTASKLEQLIAAQRGSDDQVVDVDDDDFDDAEVVE